MGEPYFQIREKLVQHGIVAFSSNYALYGDLSQRVMTVIDSLVVNSTAYSIDEAFCDLGGMTLPLVRIPRSSGHPFHEHLTTDSTLIRPPIPRASGH